MKQNIKIFFKSFNLFEILLLSIALTTVLVISIVFKADIIAIFSSVIGITSIIINAKGNVVGAILGIFLSVFYSLISLKNSFYGEVIIYVVLLIPMNVFAIIGWFRNRTKDKMTVKISPITNKDWLIALISSSVLLVGAYFLLKAFNTSSLILSTISVVTCVVGTYFNTKRNRLTFLFFMINNFIVIAMWTICIITTSNISVTPIIVCSSVNCVSNVYGFLNWNRLYKKQRQEEMELNTSN